MSNIIDHPTRYRDLSNLSGSELVLLQNVLLRGGSIPLSDVLPDFPTDKIDVRRNGVWLVNWDRCVEIDPRLTRTIAMLLKRSELELLVTPKVATWGSLIAMGIAIDGPKTSQLKLVLTVSGRRRLIDATS